MADRSVIRKGDQDRVRCYVFRLSIEVRAGVIDVTPVLYPDQVRDLCDVVWTTVKTRQRSRDTRRRQRAESRCP